MGSEMCIRDRPSDPSGDDSDSQTIRIEFMDASGKKKTLVIEYQ